MLTGLRAFGLVLLVVGPVSAQTVCETACTVPANAPVEVVAEQADSRWTYTLTMNGTTVVASARWFDGTSLVYAFPSGFLTGSYAFRLLAQSSGALKAEWANALTVLAPGSEPVPEPEPEPAPPPPPAECVADGTAFPVGTKKQWTFTSRHGQVGQWIDSQEVNGWVLVSWTQRRGTTTVVMTCQGR